MREQTLVKTLAKRLCECRICHGDKVEETLSCTCTCNGETNRTTLNFYCKGSIPLTLCNDERSNIEQGLQQCTNETNCECIYHALWKEIKAFDSDVHLVDTTTSDATSALQTFLLKQKAQEVSTVLQVVICSDWDYLI